MLLKYCLRFQIPSAVCLAGWVLFIPQCFCASTNGTKQIKVAAVSRSPSLACSPPDFPEGGKYVPISTEYEVGEKVTYFCKDGFKMFGKDRITCLSTGKWSGSTPFCDYPTKLKNPIASSQQSKEQPSVIIDNSTTACFKTTSGVDQYVRVSLDRPAVVYAVRIYFPEGKSAFKISLSSTSHSSQRFCSNGNVELASKDWVKFDCNTTSTKAGQLTVQVNGGTASSLSLCEIEVYAKDDDWCQDPPNNYLPNSQLQVSRNRADFKCNVGYKAKDHRRVYATCESHKWSMLPVQCQEILCVPFNVNLKSSEGFWEIEGRPSKLSVGTKSSLQCKSGYHITGEPRTVTCLENGKWNKTNATCKEDKRQKDSKAIIGIVVGTVVVLLIFILLGLTIYFVRKKSKEVVVIYKPGEDNSYSKPPSIAGQSTSGLSEGEYSTVYYEAIQNNQYDPRTPPPKPPNLVPKVDGGYSKPVDDRSYMNTAPANQFPTDLAFGTLTKSSSLYNSMN